MSASAALSAASACSSVCSHVWSWPLRSACAAAMIFAAAFLAAAMVSVSFFCAAARASASFSATCVSAVARRERSRVASSAAAETSFTYVSCARAYAFCSSWLAVACACRSLSLAAVRPAAAFAFSASAALRAIDAALYTPRQSTPSNSTATSPAAASEFVATWLVACRCCVIMSAFVANERRSLASSSAVEYERPSDIFHELKAITISDGDCLIPALSAASFAAIRKSASAAAGGCTLCWLPSALLLPFVYSA
mmetsp:Transcript_15430/g.31199  ORF Transcript_15430/g.31199 Transcript_15430/m.31199 type:complete len:254 (+) Transcript_15430:294-1055(+)